MPSRPDHGTDTKLLGQRRIVRNRKANTSNIENSINRKPLLGRGIDT